MHNQFYIINERLATEPWKLTSLSFIKELKTQLYAAPRVCGVTDRIIETPGYKGQQYFKQLSRLFIDSKVRSVIVYTFMQLKTKNLTEKKKCSWVYIFYVCVWVEFRGCSLNHA